LVQGLSQGNEVTDIGSGILKDLGRERASSPVITLESFALINSNAQQISGESCQAQLGNTGEVGGDAGIE
jgi:hypothetical protein